MKIKMTPDQLSQLGAGILQLVPMKRFGKAEEVAEMINRFSPGFVRHWRAVQRGGGIEA